jgi:hypothetical protein
VYGTRQRRSSPCVFLCRVQHSAKRLFVECPIFCTRQSPEHSAKATFPVVWTTSTNVRLARHTTTSALSAPASAVAATAPAPSRLTPAYSTASSATSAVAGSKLVIATTCGQYGAHLSARGGRRLVRLPGRWSSRRSPVRVASPSSLGSHRDVHQAARRAQVEHALGLPADAQCRVLPRVRHLCHRIHGVWLNHCSFHVAGRY